MAAEKDLAREYADKELRRLARLFRAAYKRASEEAQKTAHEYFEAFKARDAEQIAAVVAGKITEKDLANWRMNQMLIGQRWLELVENMANDYANANRIALALTNGVLPDVFAMGRNFAAYSIEHGAGMNLNFLLYDRHTVERLVKDAPRLLPFRKLDIPKDQLWNQKRITAEMLQGVLQGDSVGHLADRLQRVTDMNRDAALRNARTCITGAENGGRLDSYREAQKKGIKLKKEWLATLDDRTRVSHQGLDGEKAQVDKPFSNGLMYPGDPGGTGAEVYNCRCTMISSIDGLNEVEPVYRRDNISGKRISDMSYKDWEREKSVEQARIQAEKAEALAKKAAEDYNNLAAEVRRRIDSGEIPKRLHVGRQEKHIQGTNNYTPGRSYIYGNLSDAQALVNQYAGTGEFFFDGHGKWRDRERIEADHVIGCRVKKGEKQGADTKYFLIHYSKDGTHIVPTVKEDKKQ